VRRDKKNTEEDTNDDETDDNESLNQEEEASINNNDIADASINNEEDDNNMDIADSDDGSYLEQDIKCTQSSSSSAAKSHIRPNSIEAATAVPSINSAKPSKRKRSHILPNSIEAATAGPSLDSAKPKPLTKTQRYNRNKRIKKAEVQVDKEQFDSVLKSLALQNAVEQELPFHPIPNDRRPKRTIKKPTKLQDPNNWCLPDPLPWCPPEELLHRP